MTDISSTTRPIPGRLGVTARLVDGDMVLDLTPTPEVLHHGIVRASVLSYLVDAVAGIPIDDDPGTWSLTTDMTVRMRAIPAPACVTAVHHVVRRGGRSVTCMVELTTQDGELVATGAIGFARVRRKDGDPPKPNITPEVIVELFRGAAGLSRPLREEAGIEVVDAAHGVVQVELTDDLRNPAGTMQGAMVALLAEAAAEESLAARAEAPVVVTDLDLRYLSRTGAGPMRTRTRLVGDGADASAEVELVDCSTGAVATLVYARAALI